MGIIGVVLFALGIAVSIALHEAGHMAVARGFGMRVRRYFIGFGPTVWSTTKGHTEYGLAALPFGGFCDIAGMTAMDPLTPEEEPHAMVNKPAWQRIAVMAGGPDRRYPAGHRDMLERLGNLGLLLSEMPPGSAPTRHRFIARGRLLAALSSATVIVEAGARSGALNVAREANSLGRGVGAVPGPITSAASTGTHLLLREGTATLVTGSHDVAALTTSRQQAPARDQGLTTGQDLDALDQERPGRSL